MIVVCEDKGTVAKLPSGERFMNRHHVGVLDLLPFLHDGEDGFLVGQPVTWHDIVNTGSGMVKFVAYLQAFLGRSVSRSGYSEPCIPNLDSRKKQRSSCCWCPTGRASASVRVGGARNLAVLATVPGGGVTDDEELTWHHLLGGEHLLLQLFSHLGRHEEVIGCPLPWL